MFCSYKDASFEIASQAPMPFLANKSLLLGLLDDATTSLPTLKLLIATGQLYVHFEE